jgi:ATP/maltotriose-dependent transcriptional regulator MalT/DNA-binding SARP family transcriptional activator
LRQLDAALTRKLTIVRAPAGYGKTTLLAQWLAALPTDTRFVWYQITAYDADPGLFVRGLVAALGRAFPRASKEAAALLAVSSPKRSREALALLLSKVPDRFRVVIVLDDWHEVAGQDEPRQVTRYLIDHLPPSLHCVLTTRTDLALPVSRLRGQGSLGALDVGDLRFSRDEVASLFTDVYKLPLPREMIDTVAERTEGWIAALYLISSSFKDRSAGEIAAFVAGLAQHERDVMSLLTDEVFNTLPPDLQAFLKATAILDVMTPELCRVVTSRNDAVRVLEDLERLQLFIVLLDEERQIYRYHHLFRSFLLSRLEADEIGHVRSLHRAAARAYESQTETTAAIEHFLRADEYSDAARLMIAHGEDIVANGEVTRVQRWIGLLPPEVRDGDAGLQRVLWRIANFQGNWEEAIGHAARGARIAEAGQDWQRFALAVVAHAATLGGQGRHTEARQICRAALATVDERDPFARAVVESYLAWVLFRMGRDIEAEGLLRSTIALFSDRDALELSVALRRLAAVHSNRGELTEALRLERRGLALARTIGNKYAECNSLNNLSVDLRRAGRLDEALHVAEETVRLARDLGYKQFLLLGLLNLGDTQDDLGRPESEATYHEALRMAEDLGTAQESAAGHLGLSVLYRRRGDVAKAMKAARAALAEASTTDETFWIAQAQAEIGLLQAISGELTEGQQLLDQAIATLSGSGHRVFSYPYRLYRAWVLAGQDEAQAAREVENLLQLTDERGWAHIWSTEASLSVPLLRLALQRGIHVAHAAATLATMGQRGLDVLGEFAADPRKSVRVAIERLTPAGVRPAAVMRIKVLGTFTVSIGDKEIPCTTWGRPQAMAVLQYLIIRRQRSVSPDELVEVFWPEAGSVAQTSLYTALSRIRHGFEQLSGFLKTVPLVKGGGGYRFVAPPGTWVDVEAFEDALCLAARADGPERASEQAEHLERAIALYTGELLADAPRGEWCSLEREALRRQFLEACLRLANIRATQGRHNEAIQFYTTALKWEPAMEEAHRGLMRSYALIGRRDAALRQYHVCEQELMRDVEAPPSEETEALRQAIFRREPLQAPAGV